MADTVLDSYSLNNALPSTWIMYSRMRSIRNISSIYKKFFQYHKNTRNITLNFGSNPLSSSGDTNSPKTQLTKNIAQKLKPFTQDTKNNTP
jgi:predicted nucleotide-binding protein (sugar kinase/HSP70/actin superfamily)